MATPSGAVFSREIRELRHRIEELERKTRWKITYRYISGYRIKELRTLKFRSIKERRKAVRLIESAKDLRDMPWEAFDERSLIVPREAVELLKKRAPKFTVLKRTTQPDHSLGLST